MAKGSELRVIQRSRSGNAPLFAGDNVELFERIAAPDMFGGVYASSEEAQARRAYLRAFFYGLRKYMPAEEYNVLLSALANGAGEYRFRYRMAAKLQARAERFAQVKQVCPWEGAAEFERQFFSALRRRMAYCEKRKTYNVAHCEELRAYREAHREEIGARNRAYREAHREEIGARNREYREAHREQIREQEKAYKKTHREEVNARNRAYYATHRDVINARALEYHAAHREERNAKHRAYYAAHREEIKARSLANREERLAKRRAYYAAHREEMIAKDRARRAQRKAERTATGGGAGGKKCSDQDRSCV